MEIKSPLTPLSICMLLIVTSCSLLMKETVLINKSDSWKSSKICRTCESFGGFTHYKYMYSSSTSDSLTISLCPSLYSYNMLIGPPLVPVIPNPAPLFFAKQWEENPFYVDILFENFEGRPADLSTIDFLFNDKKKMQPDFIFLLDPPFDNDDSEVEQISEYKYVFRDEAVQLRFYFNIHRNKVHHLSIDFSRFEVDFDSTHFTRIDFVKRSRFLYDPIVITN